MNLCVTQKEALEKFRAKVQDVSKPEHDDIYLLKWLKARKFDVRKAEDMFRKSMAWRKTIGADKILEEWTPPEVMEKYFPGSVAGRDREGSILVIDPFGYIDLKGIMMSVKKTDILKTMIHRTETIHKLCREYSTPERPIHQCVHLQDMAGFSARFIWKPAAALMIDILHMLEDNYPETLKTTYIINAPKIFVIAYNFLKKFLNPDTAKKFIILDSHWQTTIFKVIDPSQIPEYYGGTKVDENGDPKCSSLICYGGPVPESFYQRMSDSIPEGSKSLTKYLRAKGSLDVKLLVPTTECVIRWMFTTEGGDVDFALYQDVFGKLEPIEEPRKVNCHLVPEDGMAECSDIGPYIVRFTNPSLLSIRKITYYVEVVSSEGFKMNAEYGNTSVNLADQSTYDVVHL